MGEILLEVSELKKYFYSPKGTVYAVDGVTFQVERGKTLGIVGESGCGKSTTGRVIMQLLDTTSGVVKFHGMDITHLKGKELKDLRKKIQIIFQDPFSSLNPRMTVSQLIAEPIKMNHLLSGKEQIEARVLALMDTVGLADRLYNTYPHELDGGRRQRIGIARALAMEPELIVCDEPVSALDVSIQAQILNLLKDLQTQLGLTYLFITHNLSVINHFADDIAVMYLGSLVEKAPVDELFENPMHPYTQALLSSIPVPDLTVKKQEIKIKGEITSPIDLPEECRFFQRCPYAEPTCKNGIPELREQKPGHFVSCRHIQCGGVYHV